MMYQIIGQAINKAGLADTHHPQDYLNFTASESVKVHLQKVLFKHAILLRTMHWYDIFPLMLNKLTITCIFHPKKTFQPIILVASNLLFYVILAFPSTYLFGLGLVLWKEAKEKKY